MVAALDLRDASLAALFIADLIADRPPWADDGLCVEYPALSWFPARGESVDAQKAVCRKCLVRRECVAWAFERPDIRGLWGATSDRARGKARELGLDVDELIDVVDTRPEVTASAWQTAPCRGCSGLLSRKDVERADGWCWACRP